MKRVGLLLTIALLSCMIVLVVCLASPYSPVVGGAKEIEELWAIEDTRQESERPLVTALENYGVPLAYDAQENTFYCTLGMENGEAWPQLHMTAPGAKGVSVCFVDDYAYDYCSDAIREGYAYELFAYTDTEYSYFNVVFTGLPQVIIHTEEEIGVQDVPIQMSFSRYGSEALISGGRIHQRGDGSLKWSQKSSYKVEFTRRGDGTGKASRDIPGFAQNDEVLLLAMSFDETLMRDRLSWDMAARAIEEQESFSARQTQYVEAFVNDEYQGVYLMMIPYDYAGEMAKESPESAARDSLYRTAVASMIRERQQYEDAHGQTFELFLAPDMTDGFAALKVYEQLRAEAEDETFARSAQRYIHLDSMLRYVLLVQAMALSDNTGNNMYVWAHQDRGAVSYRFVLWDMDLSWDCDPGYDRDYWFTNRVHDRVINLDVGGARTRIREIWMEMKRNGFTPETVRNLTAGYVHELEDSGAFARDAARWNRGIYYPESTNMVECAEFRFGLLDTLTQYLAETKESVSFLDVKTRGERHVIPIAEEVKRMTMELAR